MEAHSNSNNIHKNMTLQIVRMPFVLHSPKLKDMNHNEHIKSIKRLDLLLPYDLHFTINLEVKILKTNNTPCSYIDVIMCHNL